MPEPEPRKAELRELDIPVVTVDTVPGRDIESVLGPVIGSVTRPRDMRASADLAVIVTETRQDAIAQLVTMATDAGADAVVGLRFDGGKISEGASEVTAYGTAVRLSGGAGADAKESGQTQSQDDHAVVPGEHEAGAAEHVNQNAGDADSDGAPGGRYSDQGGEPDHHEGQPEAQSHGGQPDQQSGEWSAEANQSEGSQDPSAERGDQGGQNRPEGQNPFVSF